MKTLTPGLRHRASLAVNHSLTVPAVSAALPAFADMPPVFATAFMVGFIEATCIEALAPYLDPGEGTVGTHVDVSHVAATAVGMLVSAEVELVDVSGRNLRFRVQCHDGVDVISTGHHERAVINTARFLERVSAKKPA